MACGRPTRTCFLSIATPSPERPEARLCDTALPVWSLVSHSDTGVSGGSLGGKGCTCPPRAPCCRWEGGSRAQRGHERPCMKCDVMGRRSAASGAT